MIAILYAQTLIFNFIADNTFDSFSTNNTHSNNLEIFFLNEYSNLEEIDKTINNRLYKKEEHSIILNFSNQEVYKNPVFHEIMNKIIHRNAKLAIFINILERTSNSLEFIDMLKEAGNYVEPDRPDDIELRCHETILFYITFLYHLEQKKTKKQFAHIINFSINNHKYNPGYFILDRYFVYAIILGSYLKLDLNLFNELIVDSLINYIPKSIADAEQILQNIYSINSLDLDPQLKSAGLDRMFSRFLYRLGRTPNKKEQRPEITRKHISIRPR